MKTTLWAMAVAAVAAYLLATSLTAVKETEMVVISQFGKPVKTIENAGLALKWPDPINTASVVDKRLQILTLQPTEFATLDRRNLVVDAFILWRVIDPQVFLASVRNLDTAQMRLETLANSEIGAAVGSRPLSQIFTVAQQEQQLDEIFGQVTGTADAVARRELGIEVVSVRPNRFGFPRQNLLAIYKRMESERDRIARQFRAEGQEEAARIRAETEREVRQLQAEAYREAQTVLGESEAAAAKIYAEAFTANPEYYQFVRSMEAYENMLGKNTSFVLSSDSPIFDYLLAPPRVKP